MIVKHGVEVSVSSVITWTFLQLSIGGIPFSAGPSEAVLR